MTEIPNFDHLMDPQSPQEGLTVEGAAVYSEPKRSVQTPEEVDQALRRRIPQTPLTREEISRLEAHRGKPVTDEEVAGMNQARARGIHTSIV